MAEDILLSFSSNFGTFHDPKDKQILLRTCDERERERETETERDRERLSKLDDNLVSNRKSVTN